MTILLTKRMWLGPNTAGLLSQEREIRTDTQSEEYVVDQKQALSTEWKTFTHLGFLAFHLCESQLMTVHPSGL